MSDSIENELKYVLRGHKPLESILVDLAGYEVLRAGYLSPEARVRHEETDHNISRVFTFKRRLANGRNVEIPQELDEATFDLLWGETNEKLAKRRYTLFDDGMKWDCDFFLSQHDGSVYFAMAEVEMPADMEAPERVHPALTAHVAFAVPRDDARFASRLLSNEDYARGLALALDAAA